MEKEETLTREELEHLVSVYGGTARFCYFYDLGGVQNASRRELEEYLHSNGNIVRKSYDDRSPDFDNYKER